MFNSTCAFTHKCICHGRRSAPIAGVWVEAVSATLRATALTGTDGSYDLLVPAGTYIISISCDQSIANQGYLCYGNAARITDISADSTGNDILIPKAAVLAQGTVIDTTHNSVPGLPVTASLPTVTDSRGFLATGVTDQLGAFTAAITNGGSWTIGLDDRIAQIIGYIGSRTTSYSTGAGSLTGNNLTVYPITCWITGSVKDNNNTPLADVSMVLRNIDSSIGARTVTANDGTYRLGAFGGEWYLQALTGAQGLQDTAEQAVTLMDGDTATVDFVAGRNVPNLSLVPVTILTTSDSQTLTGAMAPGANVTLTVDTSAMIGTVTTSDGNSWSCPISALVEGDNVVMVTATLDGQQQTTVARIFRSVAGSSELPLVITTDSLPDGNVNLFYQQIMNAMDGKAPYLWSIGSGALPTGLAINAMTGEISGRPGESGTFSFTVQVKDGEGSIATRSYSVGIGNEIFKAYFTATPLSGQTPLTVFFNDLSSGSPTSWSWSFGDGGTSNKRNPQHIYTTTGTYTISLTTGNGAAGDTMTRTGYVTVGVCSNQPVRRLHDLSMLFYSDFTSAYTEAVDGDSVQLQAVPIAGDLILARDVQIKLRGGFDCQYADNAAVTLLNGALRISGGTVVVDKLRIVGQ